MIRGKYHCAQMRLQATLSDTTPINICIYMYTHTCANVWAWCLSWDVFWVVFRFWSVLGVVQKGNQRKAVKRFVGHAPLLFGRPGRPRSLSPINPFSQGGREGYHPLFWPRSWLFVRSRLLLSGIAHTLRQT